MNKPAPKKNPPTIAVRISPEFASVMLKHIQDMKADAQVAKDDGSAGPIVNHKVVEGFDILGSAINTAMIEFLRGPPTKGSRR